MNELKRKKMLDRLARVEGQIRGIRKLVDSSELDCEKVAQQLSAARKALDKTSHAILACMLEKHMLEAGQEGEAELSAQDMAALISKYA